MPLRLVCTCSDATVRLLSPGSGECITTMLLPSMSIIADVAYAAAESMFPVIVFQRHDYNKIVILKPSFEIGRVFPHALSNACEREMIGFRCTPTLL